MKVKFNVYEEYKMVCRIAQALGLEVVTGQKVVTSKDLLVDNIVYEIIFDSIEELNVVMDLAKENC